MIGTARWQIENPNGQEPDDTSHTDQRDHPRWEPTIVPMNTIEPRTVKWLWKNRIPNGKLVSLSGNPGLGKTLVLMDISSRVTTGADWPDGERGGEPGGVVICSAEDDPHDTLRPRLDAAGADVSRINLVQSVVLLDAKTKKKSERLIDLQQDRDAIGKAMDGTANCKLLIMDPINAYLGKTDSYKNAEVRQVLGPVAEMCHRKGVAFIYLGHLNKTTNGPALYRAAGSIAFVVGSPRSVHGGGIQGKSTDAALPAGEEQPRAQHRRTEFSGHRYRGPASHRVERRRNFDHRG